MGNTELIELTRRLINLKLEKKSVTKDYSDQIKETEADIKKLVKETGK